MNTQRFYKELGNLFYSIAAADGRIGVLEKKIVEDEVKYAWKHFDHGTDRFGSDRAFLIEFEFEAMEDSNEPAESAFNSFEEFFEEYASMMDAPVRKKIFNSARHIAEITRKINQDELSYLIRLRKLMGIEADQ